MDPECLVGAKGEVWRVGTPGNWGRAVTPPQKKWIFQLKWRVLVHTERYVLSVSMPEKCWIFRLKLYLVDVEDVLLGNSEYSVRIMGLISFLLHHCMHCNASNLVFKILKHKIWGTICISVPTPNSRVLVPCPPWFTPMAAVARVCLLELCATSRLKKLVDYDEISRLIVD